MKLFPPTDDKEEVSVALNNSRWDVEQDAALMSWATQQPADWQVGGRCSVYMWGSGRHGQLAETGGCGGCFRGRGSKGRKLGRKEGKKAR